MSSRREINSVCLPIDLLQLDTYKLEGTEDAGVKEIAAGIERMQQATVVFLYHRLKLIDVADEEHLLTAKGLTHVTAVDTQQLIDEVDNVGTNHAYLVDNNQFQLLEQFNLLATILHRTAQMAYGVAGIVGKKRIEGKFEKE